MALSIAFLKQEQKEKKTNTAIIYLDILLLQIWEIGFALWMKCFTPKNEERVVS